jgi:hypothetical protein
MHARAPHLCTFYNECTRIMEFFTDYSVHSVQTLDAVATRAAARSPAAVRSRRALYGGCFTTWYLCTSDADMKMSWCAL